MLRTSIVVIIATLLACTARRFHVDDENIHRATFKQYKENFGKSYAMHEEEAKFRVFESNLKTIDERNARELAAGGEECHGLTGFLDMTQEEYNRRNTLRFPEDRVKRQVPNDKLSIQARRQLTKLNAEGDTVMRRNWIGKLTTPVKYQEQCGSCWAFAATSQLESMVMKEHGMKLVLSPAQMTQCTVGFGCNGGFSEYGLTATASIGGLSLDEQYPYDGGLSAGTTGTCQTNKISPVVSVGNVIDLNTNQSDSSAAWVASVEKDMAAYVLGHAPLAIYVDASAWNTYTGGVMSAEVCGKDFDHAVQIVGINLEAETPYWVIRNSWADSFGEAGYIRVRYGDNACDLTISPMTVSAELADITAAFEL